METTLSSTERELHTEIERLMKRADELDRALDLVTKAKQLVRNGGNGFKTGGVVSSPKKVMAQKGETTAKPKRKPGGGRGRPKGSGKRAQQALEIITANPGITITEVAERMGIKPNYLYRVVPTLPVQKDGEGKLTAKI